MIAVSLLLRTAGLMESSPYYFIVCITVWTVGFAVVTVSGRRESRYSCMVEQVPSVSSLHSQRSFVPRQWIFSSLGSRLDVYNSRPAEPMLRNRHVKCP